MRTLIWNSWITPAGGMERVALSIANGLAARGREVYLTGPFHRVPVLQQAVDPRVHYVDFAFEKTPRGLVDAAFHLRAMIRRHRIDVVSAHGSLFPLLTLDVPVVWTEHGLRYGAQKVLSGPRALAWGLIRNRLHRGHWHFVGCSAYVRDAICEQFTLRRDRASVIYNGVPSAGELEALPLPRFTAPYKIGFLGRLEPEKHPLDIFVLDRYLQEHSISCEWHVFGEGSLAAEMRRRAEAEGKGRIHMHGLAARPAAAFASMDVLTFLSHGEMEGLPTVLLEARHARRPAIAWDVTANPEAIGDRNHLVATPFDLSRYAERLASVLTAGKPIAAEKSRDFSYDRMVTEYEGLLERIASRAGRSVAPGSVKVA